MEERTQVRKPRAMIPMGSLAVGRQLQRWVCVTPKVSSAGGWAGGGPSRWQQVVLAVTTPEPPSCLQLQPYQTELVLYPAPEPGDISLRSPDPSTQADGRTRTGGAGLEPALGPCWSPQREGSAGSGAPASHLTWNLRQQSFPAESGTLLPPCCPLSACLHLESFSSAWHQLGCHWVGGVWLFAPLPWSFTEGLSIFSGACALFLCILKVFFLISPFITSPENSFPEMEVSHSARCPGGVVSGVLLSALGAFLDPVQ